MNCWLLSLWRTCFSYVGGIQAWHVYFEWHSQELGAADDVNLSIIAGRTHGFSGADLATLVMHANFRASKDGAKEVSMAHLKYTVDEMIRSAEAWNYYIQTVMDENPKRKTRVYDSDSSMRRPQYMTYEQTLPV